MVTIRLVSKESMWYAMLFVLNVIFITLSIIYSQTTVYQTIIQGNERLEEIDTKLLKLTAYGPNAGEERREKEITIMAINKGIAELQRTMDFRFAEIEGRLEQTVRGLKEQMEQRMGEIKSYLTHAMRTEIEVGVNSLFSSINPPLDSISRDLSSLSSTINLPLPIQQSNAKIEEKKMERRVEKFDPIKENHKSESANLHMVMKGDIEKKSVMGVGASFLSHFTTLHVNLTINRIERMDVYYESGIYPNGFSIFYNLDVSNFRSSYSNPSLAASLQKSLREKGEGDQLVCEKCKLIAHAKIPFDFQVDHPSSFPSLRNQFIEDTIGGVILEESLTVRVYDPSVRVNFITTSFNVPVEFERQLGCIKRVYELDPNIRWIIVDYPANNTGRDVKEIMKDCKVPHLIVSQDGNFNKVRGLNAAADLITSPDEILFFLDVDMSFDSDFSHTIRSRTFLGDQVFYPICYSFHSNGSPPLYRNGYYREGGIGNLGIFRSDFQAHPWSKRGQNEEKWGREDNYMFEALSASHFVTYRTYEPLFFHLYHEPRTWHS